MKYKWILFGVGSVVAVVLCWVFGVFICYDRIELTVRVGKVNDNLWKRRIKRDKCLRNACQ